MLLYLFEFWSVSRLEDVSYLSWIPNWSRTRRRALPYHSQTRTTDTYKSYPFSPGYSVRATLTFHEEVLQVYWHPSPGGLRRLQVSSVMGLDCPLQSEEQKAERIMKMLLELFPLTLDSTLRCFIFSSFITMIVEFHHSYKDKKLNSPSLDEHIGDISQMLPKSSNTEVFDSLKTLGSLLRDYWLFELTSSGSNSQVSAGYGISPERIRVGDVMVPLWNMRWEPHRFMSLRKTTGSQTTMLVVRRIPNTTSLSSKCNPIETGQIIYPSVCILLGKEEIDKPDPSIDASPEDRLSRNQQCSIRLV